MLVSYVTNYEKYLAQLNQISQSPFTSVGFYQETENQLIEQYWLNNKSNKKNEKQDHEFNASTLLELMTLDHNSGILTQACLQLLPKQPESFKAEILNALYYCEDSQRFAKNLIIESNSSLLLTSAVSDPELIGLRLLDGDKNIDEINYDKHIKHAFSWLVTPVNDETSCNEVIDIYHAMLALNLLDSVLMSLFLWLLTPEQVNGLCNYASKINSDDDTLLLLAKSGIVKHTLLINSALMNAEKPHLLIAQIRRNLASQLDQLVSFDVQLQAWQGDNNALIEFQTQLQKNWPTFQHGISSKCFIAGVELSTKLNTLQCLALDKQSLFLYQLFLKYHEGNHIDLQHEAA